MPSQTYHLRREHMDYLDSLCDDVEELNNPSQALKYVIDRDMEAEQ